MTPLHRFAPWVLLFGLTLAPRLHAQELDDQTRSAARELATEGSKLYQQNDFEGAYDRFLRAYQLVQRPNVGIWAARSLVRAGRWVEASERYLELERSGAPAGAPAEQVQAVTDAAKERRELLPRLPGLTITIEGVEPGSVFVSLDGRLVKPALIGVKQPVNPGKLLVKGVRGEQVVEVAVELAEAQMREVKLVFTEAAPAASDSTTPEPPAPVVSVTPAAAPSDGGPSTRQWLGWVGVGVGGAALVAGGVLGALAASDKSELDQRCPQRRCPPEHHGDNDAYDTKKTLSSVGLIGGAVLAGAGAALLLTAPSRPVAGSVQVRGFVGVGRAGVAGVF